MPREGAAPTSVFPERVARGANRFFGSDPGRRDRNPFAAGATGTGFALAKARGALAANRLEEAEYHLRNILKESPDELAALTLLAAIPSKQGRLGEAESKLRHVLERAPDYRDALEALASVLIWQGRTGDALELFNRMLAADPHDRGTALRKAWALAETGDQRAALRIYESLLRQTPTDLGILLVYGQLLGRTGRRADSIAIIRRVIQRAPSSGSAWLALADLKSYRFEAADIACMRGALHGPDLTLEEAWRLHFALGHALEEIGRYAESFQHYSEGNRLRRSALPDGWPRVADEVDRSTRLFTRDFFEAHAGLGCPAPDPIFIVGMPRSGSTLIEQILSCHPQIEGTSELPLISSMAQELAAGAPHGSEHAYPEMIAQLSGEELRLLGERYLSGTLVYRREPRPFFTDKMPSNWRHLGLIHLILPNAKIVDVRRNPLDCCFSNFTQHFPRGHEFTFSLRDLGEHYRHYARALRHFEEVLPGRVYPLVYERLVEEPEAEIRRLLDHLGLPFDPACLRFHANDRAVSTPSAEQVRRPINRKGIGRWKPYAPWLQPLMAALGPDAERPDQ